jgi:hypothetical protein
LGNRRSAVRARKLLEFLDGRIYSFGPIVSGHTLKHFAAAAASLAILRPLALTDLPTDRAVK